MEGGVGWPATGSEKKERPVGEKATHVVALRGAWGLTSAASCFCPNHCHIAICVPYIVFNNNHAVPFVLSVFGGVRSTFSADASVKTMSR